MHRAFLAALVIGVGGLLSACEQAKSANPLSPSIAGPIPGVNISAPQLLEPGAGAQITPSGEPVSLLIENPSSNSERPLWLRVELSAEPGFGTLLHHADRVNPGDNGRTSYRIPDLVAPGYTYYWRVKAQDGANEGPYSAVRSFSVVEPVILDPPTPLEPIGNITSLTPVFKVRNGRIVGTTGVEYRIEVATAPDPGSVIAVLSGPADPSGVTSIPANATVPYGTTFYWRAFATDGSTTTGYSNAVSFRTPANPGGGGGGGGGGTTPPPVGTRTPNPAPGQRLSLPGYGLGIVEEIAGQYPSALRNSCQEHGGTWEFMDRLVDRLRTRDTRWGYNGKRGNANDPSMDIVDYNYGSQADQGTTEVYIIDVLAGHCGSNPVPAWIDQTEATRAGGTIGRW
ncbi:MAG: hypothetical protein IT178_11130, partial [Acidobacteria bacterium]|nr:hypothetical protein [Acidobacteriota bacterium]